MFVFGIFLCWTRWRSGSTLLVFLLHALFNLEGAIETMVFHANIDKWVGIASIIVFVLWGVILGARLTIRKYAQAEARSGEAEATMTQEPDAKNALPTAVSGWRVTIKTIASAFVPSLLLYGYGAFEWILATNNADYAVISAFAYLLVGTLIGGPVFSRIQIRIPGRWWARGEVLGLCLWFVDMLVVLPAIGGGPLGTNLGEGAGIIFLIISLIVFVLWGAFIGARLTITEYISALVPSLLLAGYGAAEWKVATNNAHFAVIGPLAYFLVGTLICGPVFSRMQIRIPGPSWARGVVFGLGLWFVDMLVVSPAIGGGLFGTNLGKWAGIVSLIVFVLWGAILGVICGIILSGWKAWRAVSSAFVVLLVVLVTIRTTLFQPFYVTGGAFLPTLQPGDYFLASKYAYGYSRYSLPLSPHLFAGRIFPTQPARGDLIDFRLPTDDTQDWLGRIVGLPGDRIQMIAGVLNINGVPVKLERIEDYIADNNGVAQHVRRYRETLPNGIAYTTLDLTDNSFNDNTPVYTVPPDHYFAMGDNRDNSTDSRALSKVGYIPFENLIGRVDLVFLRSARTPQH
jgi:signal peptidase I